MEQVSPERSIDDLSPEVDSELLNKLVNFKFGVLGRTVSTKEQPNTSGIFYFWFSRKAAEARPVDIGSVVVAVSDDGRELVFSMVNEIRSFGDSATFIGDYAAHGAGDPESQAASQAPEVIVGTCAVVRSLSGRTRPVTRSRILFPTAIGIQFAFGMINALGKSAFSGAAVPVGIYENGDGTIAPVSIDENYMVGPEAAHINVSGISGLASKTSTLEFCMKSLLRRSEKKIGIVVVNVKSKDLLYIDQVNNRLLNDAWSCKVYENLDMPLEGFTTARFFAPAHPKKRDMTQSQRELHTEPFKWDLQQVYPDVPTLFHPSQWDENIEGAWYVIKEEIERNNIKNYDEMMVWLDKLLSTTGLTEWPRGFPTATWRRLKSDLKRFTQVYRGLLVDENNGIDIPWEQLTGGQVFVIDIEMLSEGGQKLVFGRVMRSVTQLLETRSTGLDSVIVFIDELNKFAPKNEKSALKSQLIEITARGRSLGLILFGAEQFASAVEKEIVENSATFFFGRTESTEMANPIFDGLTAEMKAKLRMLPQGQTLVKFAKFPQPIFVRFPYPPAMPGDDFRMEKYLEKYPLAHLVQKTPPPLMILDDEEEEVVYARSSR
ncbi:MAG: ATP-binding protein [Capsulimonadaceae bacterium]